MMARVPIDRITEQGAYDYFAGWSGDKPLWSRNLSDRQTVFTAPGKCYRPNLVYHPGIQRFLLITLPWNSKGDHDRYLGLFDAPILGALGRLPLSRRTSWKHVTIPVFPASG